MRKHLLREPLVHFLLIGALLFVFARLSGRAGEPERRVEVTSARVEQLRAIFERTWQRPPTVRELSSIVEDFVKEEIYAREARAMGLDRDDTVIRRRLRQKLEFLTDDLDASVPPSDDELRAYLDEHREVYRIPPRIALEQVYVEVDRRGAAARDEALALLERLRSQPDGLAVAVGDRLPLDIPARAVTPAQWARLLGERFAEAVVELPVGEWNGPVESGYGLHLVRVTERTDGRDAELEEVRTAVERDWTAERRRSAGEEFYRAARARYEVVLPEGFAASEDSP